MKTKQITEESRRTLQTTTTQRKMQLTTETLATKRTKMKTIRTTETPTTKRTTMKTTRTFHTTIGTPTTDAGIISLLLNYNHFIFLTDK